MNCKSIIHPFQNDPGVSQSQRVMDDLLNSNATIDGRSTADLLDYFIKLSSHINFYDEDNSIKDWKIFFEKSLPFTLASVIKFNQTKTTEKIAGYNKLFTKKPTKRALQLLLQYVYNNMILPVNKWQEQFVESGLPFELLINKIIKDKLKEAVKKFIIIDNASVKWFCVTPLSFDKLVKNEVNIWDIDVTVLYSNYTNEAFKALGKNNKERLVALQQEINTIVVAFTGVMQVLTDSAALSMDQAFFPLKEELKKLHPPHLAILFSFLKLFRHLQDDMNGFTKKHLDFFYKNVLKLQAREAVADKAHIVFEIQKQLDKYLLKKGLLLKDGKDNNKAEILFATDEEIVINKTQIAEKKTLFLNNSTFGSNTYLEAVYIASNAEKADGVEKDFEDASTASWATVGNKYSKYIDPENKFIKPHPNARIGFVLASPVLLLNEGKREITITLNCDLNKNYCASVTTQTSSNNPCCEENNLPGATIPAVKPVYPNFEDATNFVKDIADKLNETFYYINRESIAAAIKKGISKGTLDKLLKLLIKQQLPGEDKLCYCPVEEKLYEITIPAKTTGLQTGYENIFSKEERLLMADIIKPIKILNVAFSGADEWIYSKPDETKANEFLEIKMLPAVAGSTNITITIKATLLPDQKAITFYDAKKLKEDIGNELPVVKIELDDRIKHFKSVQGSSKEECCERKPAQTNQPISLYHFFRNVIVLASSKIDVKVCGVKNFIAQNDESVQDVNGPVYPFGTRPSINGFDLVNPIKAGIPKNLVGPSFYIGSKEIFGKKWNNVFVNINWKDKPASFNEYYKAYIVDKADQTKYGLDENKFEINISLLEDGKWKKEKQYLIPNPPPKNNLLLNPVTLNLNRPLFRNDVANAICDQLNPFDQTISVSKEYIENINQVFRLDKEKNTVYKANTQNGFLKLNLQNQDFLHKDYAFILGRQMMALGKFPKEFLEGATYISAGNTIIVFEGIAPKLVALDTMVADNKTLANTAKNDAATVKTNADAARVAGTIDITDAEYLASLKGPIGDAKQNSSDTFDKASEIKDKLDEIKTTLSFFDVITGKLIKELAVIIPNEPWTPIIKNISLDYTASATTDDIELIHLYPYAGTYKKETITLQQPHTFLFPTYCDEGTLYIGLKDLQPGSNVNMLFQLAEATADSESKKENIQWHYLENNNWKILRTGFEVLDDDTDGLTTSGIVKFALPANMTNENTVLPKGLHWIKATIPQNSKTVCETIAIFTQAIKTTFTKAESNDTLRLNAPLTAGSLAKLQEADSSIKKTTQPFDSFGGRLAEADGHFYVRASELLRHKGRAIQKFDYERLALEAFPQLFKVKCINHSFALNAHTYINDIPLAPGYVLLAVIPDLNQLKASQQFEPKVPVSILGNVEEYLRMRTSPFARVKAMNPRYEKVHFCLKIKLYLGKDENFYKEKLQQDLREFLAPWAVGVYDKLNFGQCINESDIVQFLETLNYLDYIIELRMQHEDDGGKAMPARQYSICPITPRSILIAGKIDICIVQQDCEKWDADARPCENQPILFSNI